jgi:hypothetical protein
MHFRQATMGLARLDKRWMRGGRASISIPILRDLDYFARAG